MCLLHYFTVFKLWEGKLISWGITCKIPFVKREVNSVNSNIFLKLLGVPLTDRNLLSLESASMVFPLDLTWTFICTHVFWHISSGAVFLCLTIRWNISFPNLPSDEFFASSFKKLVALHLFCSLNQKGKQGNFFLKYYI